MKTGGMTREKRWGGRRRQEVTQRKEECPFPPLGEYECGWACGGSPEKFAKRQ